MLQLIDESVDADETFAVETTLSSRNYLKHIRDWKKKGFKVVLIFIELDSPELAVQRVAQRVREGGHNIPKTPSSAVLRVVSFSSPSIAQSWTRGILTAIPMEPSTLQKSLLTERPLEEVIEEAAREAAEEVRDRNKRMGWPLITAAYLRQEEEFRDNHSALKSQT